MAIDNLDQPAGLTEEKVLDSIDTLVGKFKGEDASRHPKMVRWFSPLQLLRTSGEVFISSILGRHADRRSIEASNRPPKYFDFSVAPHFPPNAHHTLDEERFNVAPSAFPIAQDKNVLWIDYVSDLGDGWNSTYAVAYQLAKEKFDIKLPDGNEETLHRGDILIFGGDEVYPTAAREEYETRLVTPYKMALSKKPEKPSFLFALPGNHDWYDSLSSFIEFFGDFEKSDFADGRWRVPQNRSYFALKLPKGWWILGVDVQLRSDLDHWQFKYFEKVVQMMRPGDRVILCCAEPYWMYNKMYKASKERYEKSNLKRLVDLIDPKNLMNEKKGVETEKEKSIVLFLAGDLHHYFRVLNHKRTKLSITSGGGGAFLHPTHGIVNRAYKSNPRDAQRYETRGYPTPMKSWLLGLWNFLFPVLNFSFGIIPAVLYLLFSWFLVVQLGGDQIVQFVPHPGELHIYDDVIKPIWLMLMKVGLSSPFLTFTSFAIVFGFILFTKTEPNSTSFRWIGGTLHGATHISAATFSCIVGAVLFKDIVQHNYVNELGAILISGLVIFLLGWFVGSFLMGLYLFVALNIFGQHITAAFSSIRIEDWKNFLRLKLDLETGEITIYPIGFRRVPRNGDWEYEFIQDPSPESSVPQHYKPKDENSIQIELIEGPIKLTPHRKKGAEISFL